MATRVDLPEGLDFAPGGIENFGLGPTQGSFTVTPSFRTIPGDIPFRFGEQGAVPGQASGVRISRGGEPQSNVIIQEGPGPSGERGGPISPGPTRGGRSTPVPPARRSAAGSPRQAWGPFLPMLSEPPMGPELPLVNTFLPLLGRKTPSGWHRVYATRQEDFGKITATRRVIRPGDRFVALPDPIAKNRWVEIRYRGRTVQAPVWDVGPHSEDDPYWERGPHFLETGPRPKAQMGLRTELYMRRYGPPKNIAGIDLSNQVWRELGLRDNDWVEWRFIDR